MDQNSRSADTVIGNIEKLILDGVFSSGERLPSERDLMERFGVGRNAIREAIAALSRNGFLSTRPRCRPVVAHTGEKTAINILDGFVQHFIEQDGGFEHLFNSRTFIEAALCRYAALHARKNDIKSLREALANNKAAISDSDEFYRTDVIYHRILYEIPENPIFLTLQTAYVSWLSVHWVKIKGGTELNRLIYSGHKAIFNAIVDRDPDEAERELKNHLRVAWERVKYTLSDS